MQRKFILRAALGGAAVLAAVIPAASLASSASASGTKIPNSPFAGYTASNAGSGSTTVTVPGSVICTSPKAQTLTTGVVVSGSEAGASASIMIQCVKGSLLEYVSGTSGLAEYRFPVNPGDTVQLSAAQGPGSTTSSASDTTTGVSETANAPGGTASGTTIGTSSMSTTRPTFASISFAASTVDGAPLGSAAPVASNMVKGNATVVQTGPLSPDGLSFVLTQV